MEREKTEEGFYKDNQKTGYWKNYNRNGTLKDSVLFENGIPKALN